MAHMINAFQSADGRVWATLALAVQAEREAAFVSAAENFAAQSNLLSRERDELCAWLRTPEGRSAITKLADAHIALLTSEAHARHASGVTSV